LPEDTHLAARNSTLIRICQRQDQCLHVYGETKKDLLCGGWALRLLVLWGLFGPGLFSPFFIGTPAGLTDGGARW
jgi:hypothetical protein